jgi:DNA replication initiation complex subunit (GINS family)
MGEEIAITFETLYDILMREKQRDDLLALEPSFFRDVIIYLQEKMAVWEKVSKDNDLFTLGEQDKIQSEMKNTRKILKDIYERREKKIIDIAINKSRIGQELDVNNLLEEEMKMYESVVATLDQFRNGVLLNVLHMKPPEVKEKKVVVDLEMPAAKKAKIVKQTVMIRFTQAIPKFVGSDSAVYGPFDQDDVAAVPADVADILVMKERAVKIKKKA